MSSYPEQPPSAPAKKSRAILPLVVLGIIGSSMCFNIACCGLMGFLNRDSIEGSSDREAILDDLFARAAAGDRQRFEEAFAPNHTIKKETLDLLFLAMSHPDTLDDDEDYWNSCDGSGAQKECVVGIHLMRHDEYEAVRVGFHMSALDDKGAYNMHDVSLSKHRVSDSDDIGDWDDGWSAYDHPLSHAEVTDLSDEVARGFHAEAMHLQDPERCKERFVWLMGEEHTDQIRNICAGFIPASLPPMTSFQAARITYEGPHKQDEPRYMLWHWAKGTGTPHIWKVAIPAKNPTLEITGLYCPGFKREPFFVITNVSTTAQ